MKHRTGAGTLRWLLCLTLMLGLMLALGASALAASAISYLDENGVSQDCMSFTTVTGSTTTWNNDWYVVNSNVTIGSRITVSGTVHLILCDGKTLNANAGIALPNGNSLIIYAQSKGSGMGTLNAIGADDYENAWDYDNPNDAVTAGIGSNMDPYNPCGTLTINGGYINATGGYASAGIGGGDANRGATVTINGGVVTATGGIGGPGIGDGPSYSAFEPESGATPFSSVTVNGGTVTATGGADPDDYAGGAGIGGGWGDHGVNFTINGGTVTATGGTAAAGIGDGASYSGDYAARLTFNGGTVTATGGAAGSGRNDYGESISYGRGAGIGGGYAPSRAGNPDAMYNRGALSFGDGVKVYAGTSPNPTTERSLEGGFFDNGFIRDHRYQYVIIRGPATSVEPEIAGYDLVLDGVLGLRCYVEVPEGFDGTDAAMTFSMPYRENQVIPYGSAATDTATGFQVFTCGVYAYQMADEITATFTYKKDGETQILTDTYSVKQYLDSLATDPESSGETLALMNATRNYGHYVQPYLYRLGTGVYQTEMPAGTGTPDIEAAKTGSAGKAVEPAGAYLDSTRFSGAIIRLNVNTGTDLVFELKPVAGFAEQLTATVDDGTSYPVTLNDRGVYRIAKQTIAANNLEVESRFTVKYDEDNVFTITASPMNYISLVLGQSTADDERYALAALYEYWAAADGYNHPGA